MTYTYNIGFSVDNHTVVIEADDDSTAEVRVVKLVEDELGDGEVTDWWVNDVEVA